MLSAANARQKQSQAVRTGGQDTRTLASIAEPTGGPTAVNHLFVSRQMMNGKNKNGRRSPKGSVAADDFHGRSSLSIPQQASNLTRTGQRRTDVRTPVRPLRDHLGKTSVESSSSFDIGSRPGSVASVNGSDDGSIGCDTGSCASIQSDRSCSSASTAREVIEHCARQVSLDSSSASECVGSESHSEFEDNLHLRPSAIAATLATLEGAAGRGSLPVRGRDFLEKGDSALAVNMSEPKKEFFSSATQAENMEIRIQELKVNRQPVPRIDSSGNSQVGSTTPSGNAGPKEELQKSSENRTLKDCGEVPVERSANVQVKREENSSLETVVRVFNPFPKQYMLPRKTLNNVRLGLYSDVNAERIGGGQTKRSSEQLQRTAYLQRQYMMQMTKQSKVNKS